MKKFIHVIDESLEEILMVLMLAAMTLIMGCQVFSRYILEYRFRGRRRSPDICLYGLHF